MEILIKIFQSISISGFVYLFGIMTLHPLSPLVLKLQKKNISYDEILDKGHKIVLLVTFIFALGIFFIIW